LNRLGVTETMERYLGYIVNIAAGVGAAPLQPVYRISGDAALAERVVEDLPGYRGQGPVRVGNDAYRQTQHDVYGAAILAATHVFFDERLVRHGDAALFERLEARGDRALAAVDQPDAGPWELRGFGKPENAFVVCTFWYVNALAAAGRRDEARRVFERLLACRNRHGLLAEHLDPATAEPWGNFVQTYSMVGLIGAAIRLSIPWDEAV
jgi:GH15 family glucan-1,4-alpha-glucosidase